MGIPLMMEYPGVLYHVPSRGNERRDIFLDDADRRKFLGILEGYPDRSGMLIHFCVLMDNQEIATLFGGMHYSAVSKSSARLEEEMADVKALRDLV